MKKLTRFIALALLAVPQLQADNDIWESKGPHVRIKKNDQDGSYVVFERSPDDRKLVKTMKNQNHKITMTATYSRNDLGFLTFGEIHDGQGAPIWRVRYGYDQKTQLLIAEDMYDARVKMYYPPNIRNDDGTLKEMPVRRVYYFYDAEGNQSKAIALVPKKGKTAEEVFDKHGISPRDKEELKGFSEEEDFDPALSTNPDKDNPFVEERKKEPKASR